MWVRNAKRPGGRSRPFRFSVEWRGSVRGNADTQEGIALREWRRAVLISSAILAAVVWRSGRRIGALIAGDAQPGSAIVFVGALVVETSGPARAWQAEATHVFAVRIALAAQLVVAVQVVKAVRALLAREGLAGIGVDADVRRMSAVGASVVYAGVPGRAGATRAAGTRAGAARAAGTRAGAARAARTAGARARAGSTGVVAVVDTDYVIVAVARHDQTGCGSKSQEKGSKAHGGEHTQRAKQSDLRRVPTEQKELKSVAVPAFSPCATVQAFATDPSDPM